MERCFPFSSLTVADRDGLWVENASYYNREGGRREGQPPETEISHFVPSSRLLEVLLKPMRIEHGYTAVYSLWSVPQSAYEPEPN